MAENAQISELTKYFVEAYMKFFRWDWCSKKKQDLDFSCLCDYHEAHKEGRSRTHPCDIIFKYKDPYSGRGVIFYTDLKSYAKGTISPSKVRPDIIKLGECIECAALNDQFRIFYDDSSDDSEIRGLFFLLCNDGIYNRDLIGNIFNVHDEFLSSKPAKGRTDLKDLAISSDQKVHILMPEDIRHIKDLNMDVKNLKGDGLFPMNDAHEFFYPNKRLNMAQPINSTLYPATIELITSDFLIIIGKWLTHENKNEIVQKYEKTVLIYYKGKGESDEEFVYLIEWLAANQVLRKDSYFSVRMVGYDLDDNFKSHFERAKEEYAQNWRTYADSDLLSNLNVVKVERSVFAFSESDYEDNKL